MKNSKFLLVLALLCYALPSCNRTENSFNRIVETKLVEKAINNSIGWAKTKDLSLLYSVIANDTSYLEIHPNDKVVKGFEDFKKAEAFWMNPDFKAIKYEIRDLKINFSKSGSIAWFFCMLNDINEWKGQPASWENTRWTGVLEKRNGSWTIVQMHFSFASK
jgi:ketosteroid isomerase-like protein